MAVNMKHAVKSLSSHEQRTKKEINRDLKQKTEAFFHSRKNANNLIDIIAVCESDSPDAQVAAVRNLHTIFVRLLQSNEMFMDKPGARSLPDADCQYKIWIQKRYTDTTERLIEFIGSNNTRIQELALCTLMKFVEAEGKEPLKTIHNNLYFPEHLFQPVVVALLSSELDLGPLISRFQEFLQFDDVRHFVMNFILLALKEDPTQSSATVSRNNMLAMLDNLSLPSAPDTDQLANLLVQPPVSAKKGQTSNNCSYREQKKMFTTCWLEFLKHKLSSTVLKRVLTILHEKVIPNMTNPLLLSDFLTEAYNLGGVISLLALNGLFVLISKFNLNYPDFYQKLYTLFEPSIFHTKYCARFFYLADLFLTSTYLPGYMVGAFAKRLSRLSLTAPPSSLKIIIPFVYNLIRRHPNCAVLLSRSELPSDGSVDPYIMDEDDTAKCNALQSSLWEFKTLQEHYYCDISIEAKKMEQKLPADETNISELLDSTATELFKKEMKRKKAKTVATTFEAPSGLFTNKDGKFTELWNFGKV